MIIKFVGKQISNFYMIKKKKFAPAHWQGRRDDFIIGEWSWSWFSTDISWEANLSIRFSFNILIWSIVKWGEYK